jgi:hypothetical protein
MKKYKFLAQTVFIVVLAFLCFQKDAAQSRVDRVLINEATRVTKDDFPFFSNTPQGARVYSVNRASSKMLSAIDEGLEDLFAVAAKHNYSKRLNYSDYTIFIARPDRLKDINNQYSPDVAVGAAQYAVQSTIKGGYIYAAGMVLAFNPCALLSANIRKIFREFRK